MSENCVSSGRVRAGLLGLIVVALGLVVALHGNANASGTLDVTVRGSVGSETDTIDSATSPTMMRRRPSTQPLLQQVRPQRSRLHPALLSR
jgi:hypothetical protein